MKRHANLSVFVPHVGCPQRCIFCDQNEISGAARAPSPAEVTALCERYLPAPGAGADTEIAFFGGSFTAVERGYMTALLEAAQPFIRAGRAKGVRLSTRPDAVGDDVLDVLARYRVTAIELGAQSMDDAVLAANRRGHTAADARSACARIRARGGWQLGLQMMLGMYGEEDPQAGALRTAREFIAMRPDTVRIYPTLVMENTPLCALWRQGEYTPLTAEAAVGITAQLLGMFGRAGIGVIRVGLHSDASLREHVAAGPFHPAFGELCYARAMRDKLEAALAAAGMPERAAALVHPSQVSRAVGYARGNIAWFAARGVALTVRADASVPEDSVRLQTQDT
ncbi:MAG: radical SAM protein [Oscillospiraceae bacterium]|nr:radical SAM protein [Oscillospiraceae bacterium]